MGQHKSDERCLLRRSLEDPAAFALFFRTHSAGVLVFMARRTLDVEASRDLTAETFAQAFKGREGFRGTTDAEATAWLYGIARHLLTRYYRRGAVERRAIEALGVRVPSLDDHDYARVIQLAGLEDVRERVAAEFDRLRPDQREAVRLRIVEELSYSEVAARLDVSESTARSRVSRGLRRLAVVLDRVPNIREAVI